MKPKVIDLFAGVGGLSLGFENSGFDVVLANEYDPSIAAAYEQNHTGTKMICGDITSLDLQKTFSDYAGKVDASGVLSSSINSIYDTAFASSV